MKERLRWNVVHHPTFLCVMPFLLSVTYSFAMHLSVTMRNHTFIWYFCSIASWFSVPQTICQFKVRVSVRIILPGFLLTTAKLWWISYLSWWRHQMETFSALLAICAGNSPVPGEFLAKMPVARSFDVFFDLGLNKRLRKQSWSWWFETLSRPLWRHWNVA